MKKFSSINKIKIDKEKPIKQEQSDPIDELRSKLHNIMDQLLSVRTYGPVSRYHTAGTMKVEGKEMAIAAIIDMLSETENKKSIKLLESMKIEMRDHDVIDNKIEMLKKENEFLDEKTFNIRTRLKKLSERYKDDSDFEQFMSWRAKDMDISIIDIIDGVDISESRKDIIKGYLKRVAR